MLCPGFTLHFQKCTDKIKTLLTNKSKFHFVQYWKQIVPCESTDKGVSSRGSRVRTKFYGSIIDSGSDRVLTMYNLTIIYTAPFLFKTLAYLCIGQIEASTSPPTPHSRPYRGHLTSLPSRDSLDSQSLSGCGEFELHPRFHVKSLAWWAIMGDAVLEDFPGKDCAFVANWLWGKG